MMESQYSSVMSTVEMLTGFRPAQLKMWCILPWVEMMEAMKELHEDVEAMSNEVVVCEPEAHNERVSWREVELMSVNARVAPCLESLIEVARPMPLPAPVIMITLPSKGLDILKIFSSSYKQ